MPRDGTIPNLRDYDPDKKEVPRDTPRMPSPMGQILGAETDGYEIAEADCPNVSGEQRRILLTSFIDRILAHIGLPAKVKRQPQYVPDTDSGIPSSRVAFAITVTAKPQADTEFRFNVPPYGDWQRPVLIVVLKYVWTWGKKEKARRGMP